MVLVVRGNTNDVGGPQQCRRFGLDVGVGVFVVGLGQGRV